MVTSLHDGMNLVAKEFVAARDDEQGVLVLSQFTGAARELHEALIVNPYHVEQSAEALYQRADHAGRRAAGADAQHARAGARLQRLPLGRPDAAGRGAPAPARAGHGQDRIRKPPSVAAGEVSMRLLFDEAGRQRLDDIVQPGMLCVFDFDGTLSPIVPQPDSAALPPEVRERLLTLATLAPVAILTGRSLADIGKRLGFEPHYVIGNHGLEGMPGWEGRSEGYATACAAWRSALELALLDKQRFDPGIRLEDKKYSLSVHYRMARNQAQAEQRLSALFETLSPPPRVVAGKCVYSLMPVDAAHKGGALEELMQQAEADDGDLCRRRRHRRRRVPPAPPRRADGAHRTASRTPPPNFICRPCRTSCNCWTSWCAASPASRRQFLHRTPA